MNQVNSPFKFLDAYQQSDADVFFGREKETHDLYNALSGVKHLLVYGPSGAGKTSLIECGLRNQFSDADWYALTIRKGADINASVFETINNSLHEKIITDPLTRMPVDEQMEFGQAVERLFAERYQPIYLLFDQFEELLISGNTGEKQKFFILLNKLIRNKIPCRILLIMREEFIGHLSEFETICPTIFQHRFRVEEMRRINVEEVIYRILEAPRYHAYFTVENSRLLTESILSKLPDKEKEIELAHVQVFLGELWDRAQAEKRNNELPVLNVSLVHRDDDLETVLESFLKKQVAELREVYGAKLPLELLAAMITERFTKLQLSAADLQKDLENKKVVITKPITDLLKELEQRRIVRTVKSGDEIQYEISHDVLAQVVGQNLTEEMKLREKAFDIYKVYQERQGLFSQDDIDYLRPFQQSLAYPAQLQARIDTSTVAIKKQQQQELIATRKRLRTVYGLLGAALIALLIAGYFYLNANAQKEEANRQKDAAEKQTSIAKANYYISEAKTEEEIDATVALRLVEQALLQHSDTAIESEAIKIFNENSFYKIVGRHSTDIYTVAVSPDGKTVLTASGDSTARLWDLNGKMIMEFRHSNWVNAAVFSPDGKTVLTASSDSTARLWNLEGKMMMVFKGHTAPVSSVAFSPDGKNILTGSEDKTARLWTPDGKIISEFKKHTLGIISVAFSPDGKNILTGSYDKTACLWSLDGNMVRQFKEANASITSLAFSPDGNKIMAGFWDGDISVWALDGKRLLNFKAGTDNIKSVAFSPDGKKILTGAIDQLVKLWSLDGKLVKAFKGHTQTVTSVTFLPDGKRILTGSFDGTARIWDIYETRKIFKGHTGKISSAVFSADGKNILTGSDDSTARLWDMEGNTIQQFKSDVKSISSVAFSPDGRNVLTGSWGGALRLWNRDGKTISDFKKDTVGVSSVAFSPDGKTILAACLNGVARLWDMNGKEIKQFALPAGFVGIVAFSPDGKTLLTAADMGARLYDTEGNNKMEFKWPEGLSVTTSIAYSPDGKHILTGDLFKPTALWSADGKKEMEFREHNEDVTSVAFSPDGKTILTGSMDGTARIWWLNGKLKMKCKGDAGAIHAVAFSPGGKTILIGTQDGSVQLWNVLLAADLFKTIDIEPLSEEQKKYYGIK